MSTEPSIHERYPHIVAWALPSPPRHAQFVDWVLWDDGADDEGNLLGFCPLHDADRKVEGSAEFNFRKGIMRCQADPRCDIRSAKHENNGRVPRAMSLSKVEARMTDAN